ncbi:putative SNF2 family helicase/ATPase [Aspergillus fischeri NRRL 181]|uniref:SNF2 family helicase/ATPase, putative n=1 Tax=Neosartorya fischeri (strain ATCC 1020 / DSM 3700 / CBS 544.65 / FGSC A1164 / JCM 1740 / NRRL 181 / WB 181) TaxID=331117 RepID=A1DM54_NEOFI|nr:SNF2 family helicase/ATPase, putative [Aspergillus fischeri NRRL 181]EAW15875.1 SNF2 family helicase/ATPase, putative [Aspergillus fischeri NRRL 181]
MHCGGLYRRKQSQDGCGDGRSLLFGCANYPFSNGICCLIADCLQHAGRVPDSLATAFAQSGRLAQSGQLESDGPPSKRRKLTSAPQSLRDVNGASENGVPNGYIALARFDLNLKFAHANPLSEKHVDDPLTPLPRLPVVLQSAGNSRHLASWTHESTSYDCFELEIATLAERETVYKESSTSPQLLEFGKHLESAHRLVCADRYHKKAPIACYQCTLHCSTDRKSFRLETLILWKDSLNIIDEKLLNARALDTFAKYVLQRDAEVYNKARNMGFAPAAIWSPRDFYDNVHVPQDTPESSAEIKSNLIHCRLYPFQRRAVRWLLEREGVKLQENGHVFPLEDKSASELPTSFEKRTDAEGKTYYVSPLFVTVTSDLSNWYAPADYLKGGILAEEMGLGKTVEMISLMCLHRRSLQPDMDLEIGGMRQSGATLIITPPAILQQWMQEIQLHAPALHVLHYTGINRHQKLSDRELLELLADQDVVLTTYDVLAREIHYSGDAPKRNLRHEKRFQPRKSPLVKISWWRVCLDEAQMIESGVSNAAKVARLIPRQNAWAVTGTPLRKDISDLLGLLLFLHYEPFCGFVWNRLCRSFHSVLSGIVSRVALRHSKDHVRSELDLPSQKRFVITIPFTAVEEQHYAQLFEQMAEDCGLDMSGAPLKDDWNPEDQAVVEKMRSWLMRLRQACLYPAGSGRRVLGFGGGPLRSVAEVLEIMIDQNDALVHAEERALVQSQLRRGQLLENALRRQQALELWTKSYERSSALVKECRIRLQLERDKSRATADGVSQGGATDDPVSDNEVDEADKNTRVSAYRQRLRAALEIQHVSIFFIGNVFYQIRTDPKLTEPDSEEFKRLEKRETESYEEAKLIRMEILSDVSRKVARYMKVIREKSERKQFVVIPKMKPQLYSKGLEARRIFDRYEEFCEVMNKHAVQYNEWRDIMVKLLSQSLIDQEDESELEGNEYERSTKHQDEMYVYMEALRAMFADRHDALTGQQNVLIAHEVKGGIIQAQQGEGPSPALFLSVMNTRSALKPAPALGSLRGIISELRSLATSLEWQGSGGSSRALAELELVNSVLQHAAKMAAEQNKVSSNLEREVEMFRDTMNNRLEYYRQLQQISDMVAPYDEESVGKPLDEDLYAAKLKQENDIDAKISTLRSKHRYLLHLRDDSGVDNASRICVICQSSFEIGVLTVCGHKYCKDCLRIWWNQHRTCPTCKKRLKVNDFHQITYKPEEFVVQEEKTPKLESGRSSNSFIYADISSGTLKEIKNIDLEASFGTKIDTLARHILWLREHDPGAKSIIFSQYKTFLEVLGTAFSRFKIGYSSIDNADGIERFKSDPAVECFFLHAKAQSSGLNLVNATHVFLCEPLVNTAIELQAIARVHRIGQHRPTTVWMYLVSDTVEQSIYELSVSRRLAHIVQKEKVKEALDDPGAVFKNLTETAIDSANSLEVQDATLAKLMTKGTAGGELVKKDDLWQCLFGNATQKLDLRADGEVARFLRGDAAEKRRTAASS